MMRHVIGKVGGVGFFFLCAFGGVSWGAEQASHPVGYFELTIPRSPEERFVRVSLFSLPLLGEPSADLAGAHGGVITDVVGSWIVVEDAGWEEQALAKKETPYFIELTSGAGKGRFLLIEVNTPNSVGVQEKQISLVSMPVKAGDTFRLVPGDTFLSVFGVPGPDNPILGGTDADARRELVDLIFLNITGAWRPYYWNTDNEMWQRVSFSDNYNHVVIPPDSGLMMYRISQEDLVLTLTGRVPPSERQMVVNDYAGTLIARSHPVDTTLKELGAQHMPGWKKVGDPGIDSWEKADLIYLVTTRFRPYYFDNTAQPPHWKRVYLPYNRDNVVIPAGAGILMMRSGQANERSVFHVPNPYEVASER